MSQGYGAEGKVQSMSSRRTEFLRRRTRPRPVCGSPPPPVCGSPPPPVCGSPLPVCGSPPPGCGSPTPVCGSPTPVCGSPTPVCGSPPPGCGSPPPVCKSRPPVCKSPPPPPPRSIPSRWSLRLALVVILALLAPGLVIGAMLHVNDILSADLLPGTLFLREGPVDGNLTASGFPVDGQNNLAVAGNKGKPSGKQRAGNWSDAFLTMNFHRTMMNEYLCRSYVAEQILGDMTEPTSAALVSAPPSRRRISSTLLVGGAPRQEAAADQSLQDSAEDDVQDEQSDRSAANGTIPIAADLQTSAPPRAPPPAPPGGPPAFRRRAANEPRSNFPGFRRKSPSTPSSDDATRKRRRRRRRRRRKKGSRRADLLLAAKDNMLADEGSSAYKDWLARTTLLEDIYRHYDNIAQSSEVSSSHGLPDDTATFEGGEVTGYALTHSAATPNPALAAGLGLVPALNAASFNLPAQQARPLHPGLAPALAPSMGLSLASSINSFAAPGLGLGSVLPGPAPAYGPPPPPLGLGISGEDRNPFEYGGGGSEYSEEHHEPHPVEYEHHEHHEHLEKGHGKMLSLKDLFDLVLTAIAFLAFGAFAIHLIMCLMMIPNNNGGMVMPVPVPTGTATGGGTDNGAGEAEGGRRRRRRWVTISERSATPLLPAVPVDVLNRAAMRVLASIDAAMLVYRTDRTDSQDGEDNSDCLRRALCKHNRFSRAVNGPFRVWMPIWSVGLSWVAGRLAPGGSSPAVSTLDNLRASLLGLGNARCHAVYPRCSNHDHVRPETSTVSPSPGSTPPPATPPSTPSSTSTSAPSTTPLELPPRVAPPSLAPAPGIIHPAYSDLPKIITMRPPPAAPAPGPAPARSPPVDDGSRFTAIGVKTNLNKKRRRRPPGPGAHAAARRAPRPNEPDARTTTEVH